MCQVLLAGILSTGSLSSCRIVSSAVPPEPVQLRYLRSAKCSGSFINASCQPPVCEYEGDFEPLLLTCGYREIKSSLRKLGSCSSSGTDC